MTDTPNVKPPRFAARPKGVDWVVVDTEAYLYTMPSWAVSLLLTRTSAELITSILNQEWAEFLERSGVAQQPQS